MQNIERFQCKCHDDQSGERGLLKRSWKNEVNAILSLKERQIFIVQPAFAFPGEKSTLKKINHHSETPAITTKKTAAKT